MACYSDDIPVLHHGQAAGTVLLFKTVPDSELMLNFLDYLSVPMPAHCTSVMQPDEVSMGGVQGL